MEEKEISQETVECRESTGDSRLNRTGGYSRDKSVFIIMILVAILMGLGSCVSFLLYRSTHQSWMLPLAITLLTFCYHLAMRLIVGETVTLLYRKRNFPQDRLGFRLHAFEEVLYRKLKVKKWKVRVITAKPEQFDLVRVSPEELLHNIMQAELVHRIIMVLSFVPVLLIIPLGAPWVFIITSTVSCLLDSVFVIIQRYNRPRVLRYLQHSTRVTRDGSR